MWNPALKSTKTLTPLPLHPLHSDSKKWPTFKSNPSPSAVNKKKVILSHSLLPGSRERVREEGQFTPENNLKSSPKEANEHDDTPTHIFIMITFISLPVFYIFAACECKKSL